MNPPASTLFTSPPDWQWLIVLYFFLGGIAGGAYFLAALMDLRGAPGDRPVARLGYLVAFPLTVICAILLTGDLGRPLRFWHMLIQSRTGMPMFKGYSPMSIGAWALLIFGGLSLLSFLGALAEREPRLAWASRLRSPGLVGGVIAVHGAGVGFFVAGYTGVLLAVSNRPIWADTPFLGLLFLVSGASSGAALLLLLAGPRIGWRGVMALEEFDRTVLVLEIMAVIAVVLSLGGLVRLWLNLWGLLLVGVVVVGILIPLALYWRPRAANALTAAAVLVLVGSFLLRVVIIFSSEAVAGRILS